MEKDGLRDFQGVGDLKEKTRLLIFLKNGFLKTKRFGIKSVNPTIFRK